MGSEEAKKVQSWDYLDGSIDENPYINPEYPELMIAGITGVSCAKCVASIESLVGSSCGLSAVEVVLAEGLIKLQKSKKSKFADIFTALEDLGFGVRPLPYKELHTQRNNDELKSLRMKTATAFVCAGNIMLLSISVYVGAPESFANSFNWISAFLCLPVVFYAALPFYAASYRAIKARSASVDMPISVAVIFGFFISFYNLWVGSEHVYFDSISALVALLLGSRLTLKGLQKKFLTPFHLSDLIANIPLLIRRNGKFISGFSRELKTGNEFKVAVGEPLPVDCKVVDGSGYVDPSMLTGESLPLWVESESFLRAGMKLRQSEGLIFQATGTIDSSDIAKFIRSVENQVHEKTAFSSLTDRWAQWFALSVLLLGTGLLFFGGHWFGWSLEDSINRSLALVIVACPCALSFSTPLIESLGLVMATRRGILIKSARVFDKLQLVKNIFFDKTGTLTEGRHVFDGFVYGDPTTEQLQNMIELERASGHPLARSFIKSVISDLAAISQVKDFKELAGDGVFGRIGKKQIAIKKLDSASANLVAKLNSYKKGAHLSGYYEDDELVSVLSFSDHLNAEAKEVLGSLRGMGHQLKILSGDSQLNTKALGRELNVDGVGSMSPEDKLVELKKFKNSAMVGDGFNDIGALKIADVGISVQGSLPENIKHTDVYIDRKGVQPVFELFKLSRGLRAITRSVLTYSVFYNVFVGLLAIFGAINPLVAAILMPVNSVLLIAFSFTGTKILNRCIENSDSADSKSIQKFTSTLVAEAI